MVFLKTINLLCTGFIKSRKDIAYAPKYSTRDHWLQESTKRIFNSGLFWAVRAAEKTAISMLLLRSVFYVFIKKLHNIKVKK